MRNERGFTLLDSVTSLAVLVVFVAVCVGIILQIANLYRSYSDASSRDELQRRIIRALTSRDALRITRQHNPRFDACFELGAATVAKGCLANEFWGLSLYDTDGTRISGPDANPGPTSQPQPYYYTLSGTACPRVRQPSSECPVSIVTSFRAQGWPTPCATCTGYVPAATPPNSSTGHELIEIRYLIAIAEASRNPILTDIEGSLILDIDEYKKANMP